VDAFRLPNSRKERCCSQCYWIPSCWMEHSRGT
jgi:hypothetical protein